MTQALTNAQHTKLLKSIAKSGLKFNAGEIRESLSWDEESIAVTLEDAGFVTKVTGLWHEGLDSQGRIEITNTRIPLFVMVGGSDAMQYFVSRVNSPFINPLQLFANSHAQNRTDFPDLTVRNVADLTDSDALALVVSDVMHQIDYVDLVDLSGGVLDLSGEVAYDTEGTCVGGRGDKAKSGKAITTLDKHTLKRFRTAFDVSMRELERAFEGLSIKLGNVRFSDSNATGKVEINLVNADGRVETPEWSNYSTFAGTAMFPDLKDEWLGARFYEDSRSMGMTIIGLNTRAQKRPVVVEGDDGKVFGFPENSIVARMSKGQYERTNDMTGAIEVFGVA
jgi:hypothetical protein